MTDIPQMSRNRCGCDCKNPTDFAVCDGRELNKCCSHCSSGAPSAYAVHWECIRRGLGASVPATMFLWRDCQFACTWSARGYDGNTIANPCIPGDYCDPCSTHPSRTCWLYSLDDFAGEPCSVDTCDPFNPSQSGGPTPENCGNVAHGRYPPLYIDPDGTYRNSASLPFQCCQDVPGNCCYDVPSVGCADRDGWHDWYGLGYVTPAVSCNPLQPGYCTANTAWVFSNCHAHIAVLEVTGGSTATLTLSTSILASGVGDVPDIVYRCDNFSCLDRSTFYLTNRSELTVTVIGSGTYTANEFPDFVCVSPAVGNYRTPCESADAACSCKDAGWGNAWLDIDSPCISDTGVALGRNTTLPACVTPQSGPCGYFWGTVAAYSGTIGFLLWCDGGTPYNLDVYCSTDGFATCSKVCDATTTETGFCPDGEQGTWSCGTFGDCCVVPCTECDPAGKTLNYDITGVGGAAGSGSGTVTGGTTFCFVKTLTNGDRMSVEVDMSTCTFRAGCNGTDCSDFNCATTLFGTVTLNSCDPFDMTLEFSTGGFLCNACGTGDYTIDIYE